MSEELVEKLREAADRLSEESWRSFSPDAGLASNLANEAADLITSLSTRLADLEKALREAQLEIANMEMTIRRAFDMLRRDKPIPVPVMDAMQKYAIRNMSPLR